MTRPLTVRAVVHRSLIWAGIAAIGCAGGTAAYGGIAERLQSWRFDQQIAALDPMPAPVVATALELHEGDVIGRLEIPRLGISVMVLQGTDTATLIAGAGHVPGTPSPGGNGNVVIAAHRDTFFRGLEGIRAGDTIRVETVRATYEYVVELTHVVDPQDTQVMESRARSELTLITCYPFYFVGSAPQRFVVLARPLAPMPQSPPSQGF
jgi:sortase A